MILADIITALMRLTWLQLLGGNLVIAALEAKVIRWWFRPQQRKISVFGIMVLSNYCSTLLGIGIVMLFGYPFQAIVPRLVGENALYVLPWALIAVFLIACGATLLVEWPFCMWAVGPRKRRFAASVKAALASQIVSYLALLALTLLLSNFTLATSIRADRGIVSRAPDIATIYYLSNDDGSLWKVRLNGSGREKIKTLHYRNQSWRRSQAALYLKLASEPGAGWYLHCPDATDRIPMEVPHDAALTWGKTGGGPEYEKGQSVGFGPAATPAVGPRPGWDIDYRPWRGALTAANSKTGQRVSACLSSPFVTWEPENPSLLPGDLLVYELEKQIVLLDLNSKRIGLIAMGRQPVVVLDEEVARKLAAQAEPATRP